MIKSCSWIILSLIIVIISWESNLVAKADEGMKMEQISVENIKVLNEENFFFGHHSVGYNILDGVAMIEKNMPSIKLKIKKLDSPDGLVAGKGILYHGEVGSNFNPYSKIDDFARWINDGLNKYVNIAFFKFCFVDIRTNTDVLSLFSHYKEVMNNLRKKYPQITFVHVTVPLVSMKRTGLSKWKFKLKRIIKKILGKDEFYENQKKYKYNQLIRNEYNGKEPVFDLAKIESTYPDGSRCTYMNSGNMIETLVPDYTNDGGHLNNEGKLVVAKNFLIFMADLK